MYEGVSCPTPEILANKPIYNSSTAEKENQTRVCHYGRNISGLINPRCSEFWESIAPDVLVDCDCHKMDPATSLYESMA